MTSIAGVLKQALISVGYPAEDLAGYTTGAALPIGIRGTTRSGLPFRVRDYQEGAVAAFYAGGDVRGGSGVIVLPCGAGKTIVGLAAMGALKAETLILTTSTTAVEQWKREILDKTDLDRVARRHLYRRFQDAGAGDSGHLPDRDLPAQERR